MTNDGVARGAGSNAADAAWPPLPYDEWHATCDALHACTQVLGKVAVALAPPEPQLQHAALRLTVRGWETAPLRAPDGTGALCLTLDLRTHEVVTEHSGGGIARVPLVPERPVAEVTRDVLDAVRRMGGPVPFNPTPQEVPWTVALDEDDEHRTYDPVHASRYFAAATRAALVLTELRAPYRGRSSPVNAWWGSFDLAVSFFSGAPADPPRRDFITRNSADAQQIEVGWWPGDARHPRAAFFGFAVPAPSGLAGKALAPAAARWDDALGEHLLDWDDVIASADPHGLALQFGRSLVSLACVACGWDPALAASADGVPPPVA